MPPFDFPRATRRNGAAKGDTMLRRTLIAMFVVLGALSLASAAAPPFHPQKQIEARQHAARQHARLELEAMRTLNDLARMRYLRGKSGKAVNPLNVTHTHVQFDADETAGTIETTSTLLLEATEDGVTSVELTMEQLEDWWFTDELDTPLVAEPADYGVIVVALPETLDTGDTVTIIGHNDGTPACDPDAFFGMTFCQVSEEITFFASPDFYPRKAAYRYEELYGGRVDFTIVTPPGYTAVTTSDPESVDDLGDSLVHEFVGHFSASYTGLAYAKFETSEVQTLSGKSVAARVHSGDTSHGHDWAAVVADVIDYFEAIYSPYVYNKHDVIQTIDELGGGVGPQSASFYYAAALNDSPEYLFSESIFSHELAHSWWGNMVRLGDGESPWLNEGFAEYSSRRYGYEVWPAYYQDYLYETYFYLFQQYVDSDDEVPLSSEAIGRADATVYQLTTYDKGAHVLRMLESLLGEDVFLAAMADYANAYTWDAADELVTVERLIESLEASTGQDMSAFFDQWVFGTGYPVYRWAAEFSEDGDEHLARVKVTQTQDGPTFDMPLEVQVWIEDFDEPSTFTVTFDGPVAEATYSLPERVRGLRVDDRTLVWGDKIPALVGDVNADNIVDGTDFIYAAWCQGGKFNDYDAWNFIIEADFDHDFDVDETDLALLRDNFGAEGTIDE
jgi:Peptidase family M1 domain